MQHAPVVDGCQRVPCGCTVLQNTRPMLLMIIGTHQCRSALPAWMLSTSWNLRPGKDGPWIFFHPCFDVACMFSKDMWQCQVHSMTAATSDNQLQLRKAAVCRAAMQLSAPSPDMPCHAMLVTNHYYTCSSSSQATIPPAQ